MLYLHLFCDSISEVCPRVSEEPMRTYKGVTRIAKLDIIVSITVNEIDILRAMNLGSGNAQNFFHIN